MGAFLRMSEEHSHLSHSFESYSFFVRLALWRLQFVEEGLRMYIRSAYEILRAVAPTPVAFRPSIRKLERASLGQLIQEFSELSETPDLTAKLRALVPQRNRIAHTSFLFTFEEFSDETHLAAERAWVMRAAAEAHHAHEEVSALLRTIEQVRTHVLSQNREPLPPSLQ